MPDLQADGIEPDTLGLFTGPEFADEGNVPLPPQIILFLENLWDFAEGDEAIFREEVRTTFLHELGHYLGLDEGRNSRAWAGIARIAFIYAENMRQKFTKNFLATLAERW